MVVDASALVAIMAEEPGSAGLVKRLTPVLAPMTHRISVYEAVTALARLRSRSIDVVEVTVDAFLARAEIAVVDIREAETRAALDAFARYGRGRHPAKLNMGDCFSYACAKVRGLPLLYTGEDFARTDLA